MKERLPLDDIIRHRLAEYESEVPDNMFERISQIREERPTEPDEIIKEKLTDYESVVPTVLFDSIMDERAARTPSSEAIISRKLLEHESEVPADMFERIMTEREGRRPVIAWWQTSKFRWVVATLFLSLLVGGYQIIKNSTHPFNNVVDSPSSESGSYIAEKSNEVVSTKETPAISQHEATIIPLNSTFHSESNNELENISGKNIIKNKTVDKISPYRPSVNFAEAVTTADEVTKSVSKTTKITSDELQTNDISPASELTLQKGYNSNHSPKKSDIAISRNSELFNPVHMLSAKGIALKALSHETVVKALPCPGPDYGCPTFQKKNKSKTLLYIDAYGAPEYALRSLKAQSTEFNEYRNTRDTVEKVQYAFSAGARASVIVAKNFILRGGVVYAQNREKYQRDSLGIGNIRYIIDKNPNTGQLDTIEVQVTEGIFRKTRYNQYRSLDFTLQGGYEFELTDNLSLGINAGVNVNIQTGRKATILGQDFQALEVSKNNSVYQTSVGTSLVGSLSAYWRLSYKWQLMVEPQFRHYLKPITQKDYALKQNYTNVGLNVGLRYRLSR